MKKFFLFSIGITFISCQKIIDVDLNTTNSTLVIQAELDNFSNANAFVKLAKTVNFSDKNVYPTVSNAIITISDSDKNIYPFTENKDTLGLYQNKNIIGIPGKTYTLKIESEGKTYTSNSTMPEPVNLTRLGFIKEFGRPDKDNQNEKPRYAILPIFDDTKTEQNLFLLNVSVNGVLDSNRFIRKSQHIPNANMRPINLRSVHATFSDTVRVYFAALNAPAYDYFFVLLEGSGGRNNTTPSNPTSNISGDAPAMGYFSAHATTYFQAIVK